MYIFNICKKLMTRYYIIYLGTINIYICIIHICYGILYMHRPKILYMLQAQLCWKTTEKRTKGVLNSGTMSCRPDFICGWWNEATTSSFYPQIPTKIFPLFFLYNLLYVGSKIFEFQVVKVPNSNYIQSIASRPQPWIGITG